MSLVAHFKRSCGTSTFDWLSVVWALQGDRDFLIVLSGVLPTLHRVSSTIVLVPIILRIQSQFQLFKYINLALIRIWFEIGLIVHSMVVIRVQNERY